jgi:Tfp pilus assembly protein PilF
LWFWDTTPEQIEALAAKLRPLGWIHSSDQAALFMRATERSRQAAAVANQARALLQQGKHPEAVAMARSALEGDPENIEAYLVLAEVGLAHGQTAMAEEMLRRAIELRPDDPSVQRFLHRG